MTMRAGLEKAIEAGAHCHICPLSGDAGEGPVWAEPAVHGKHRLTIVGESPGRNEVFTKKPFAGKSGALLFHELGKIGVKRSECHLTNAALCRGDGGDKEALKAAECCAPRLLRELSELDASGVKAKESNPKARLKPVFTLGRAPTSSILNIKAIMMARGFIWTAKEIHFSVVQAAHKKASKGGAKREALMLRAETLQYRRKLAGAVILPSVHPSFVLRSDVWAPILRLDIARLGRVLGGLDLARLDDNAPHLIGGPELLKKLKGASISLDVETDGVDPHQCKLLCVGMSDGVVTIVLWPWAASWARPLNKYLRTRREVVCHNGNYDRVVLENHGVK